MHPEFRCKHRWAACFTKKATAALPKPVTYYATYYTSAETWLQGTATYLDNRGWVFRDEDDSIVIAYADHASLVLGGHKATAMMPSGPRRGSWRSGAATMLQPQRRTPHLTSPVLPRCFPASLGSTTSLSRNPLIFRVPPG